MHINVFLFTSLFAAAVLAPPSVSFGGDCNSVELIIKPENWYVDVKQSFCEKGSLQGTSEGIQDKYYRSAIMNGTTSYGPRCTIRLVDAQKLFAFGPLSEDALKNVTASLVVKQEHCYWLRYKNIAPVVSNRIRGWKARVTSTASWEVLQNAYACWEKTKEWSKYTLKGVSCEPGGPKAPFGGCEGD